ncbi:hypothetical protein ACERII_06650 [Evansella sp. AB-rgal1]|uniref:hypothetical protein n=1 Tax=Evansella sp. AB-rgal1 TaxID=3242696 RepID=UPI00359D7ED7
MAILSTGPIENNPVSGLRPTRQVTIKISNNSAVDSSTVTIQGFALNGSRTLYVSEQVSVAPNQVITRTYFGNLNAFEYFFTTSGPAEEETDISVWGKNAAGEPVAVHRLVSSELMNGDDSFEWGEETIIWADSSATGPGNGTPSDPYNSLQAAITAATTSPFAVTFGMRARLIILIAANSAFDEDIVIPPARHVQLLGLGPWVLGNAQGANFSSTTPRNVTIQTNQAAENIYFNQGPAFVARPVTVIGTFDNGTSVSTHTNYTNGATISGNITFQNVAVGDPFTTIEFQLLNTHVVGSIIQSGHQGQINTYVYNSRLSGSVIHNGLRLQRLVDSRTDGDLTIAVYSHISNSLILGNVTVTAVSFDVPPTGIFSSQFANITWTGPLRLDTASNFYFVDSGSTLVGTKTILFSLA